MTREHTLWIHFRRRLNRCLPELGYLPAAGISEQARSELVVKQMLLLDWNWTSENPRPERSYSICIPSTENHVEKARLLSGGQWLLMQCKTTIRLWNLRLGEELRSALVAQSEHQGQYLMVQIDDSDAPNRYVIATCGRGLFVSSGSIDMY